MCGAAHNIREPETFLISCHNLLPQIKVAQIAEKKQQQHIARHAMHSFVQYSVCYTCMYMCRVFRAQHAAHSHSTILWLDATRGDNGEKCCILFYPSNVASVVAVTATCSIECTLSLAGDVGVMLPDSIGKAMCV